MLLVYLYLPPNGLRPAPRSGRGPVGAKRPHALCGVPVALAPPRSALAGVMRAGGRDETTLLCRNHKLHKVLENAQTPTTPAPVLFRGSGARRRSRAAGVC